jgi:PAS domain S-box-containing protein
MLFVTVVLLAPFGLSGYEAYQHYGHLKDQALNKAIGLATSLAGPDFGIGVPIRQLLLTLAQDSAVLGLDGERCSQIAKSMLATNQRYVSIGAATLDGTMFCLGNDILPAGRDVADRGWFQDSLANRGFSAEHYVIGRNMPAPMLAVGYLAAREGEAKAVVFAGLNLAWISRAIQGLADRKYIATYLLDRSGLVLARSHDWDNAIGKRIEDASFRQALARGTVEPFAARGLAGSERIFVLRPLETVGGGNLYFAAGLDSARLAADAFSRLSEHIFVFAVVAFFAYLVAWWGGELAILIPIRELAAKAEQFSGGDFSARIGPHYARNEIGTLGRSLDAAAEAVGLSQDKLKTSEAHAQKRARDMETLFQASPYAIIALDRETRVMWWNQAAERIFGYSAAEAIGRPHPVVPELEQGHFRDHFERALQGEMLRNIRGVRRARDGRKVEVEFSSAPLVDSGGGIVGVVYMVNDVTERIQLERQFLQAQKMESVGQLTGGIAHDFNNLLGILIGNLDLVRERIAGNPEALELVDTALNAGLRGAELNKRLLAFARRQSLSPEIVDVNASLTAMTELLRHSLGERIGIRLECATDVWPVRVDPSQMETAIVNLAVNARDAMPEGGTLILETRNVVFDAKYAASHAETKPGDYVMLAVSDTGTGMTPEVLARVFDPFFTTKPVGKGTGLGLSMVYGFLKQSGGHVNVYSEPGKGTTVRLYLPRAVEGKARTEIPAPATGWAAGGELVLVVEDNPDMRRVAVRQLKEFGYRVAEAENADRARGLLDEGLKPDLVFTDIVMSGATDGIAFAEEVAVRWPEIRILFTSGFTERATVEARKREGRPLPFALLDKPYRKDELARAVRAALDNGK